MRSASDVSSTSVRASTWLWSDDTAPLSLKYRRRFSIAAM